MQRWREGPMSGKFFHCTDRTAGWRFVFGVAVSESGDSLQGYLLDGGYHVRTIETIECHSTRAKERATLRFRTSPKKRPQTACSFLLLAFLDL